MKRLIFTTLSLVVASCLALNAQSVTGVSIVNYQAKSTDTNPKMFVIPMVASMEIVKDAQTTFSSQGVIKIPAKQNTMNESDYLKYVENLVKQRINELKSQVLFEFSEAAQADLILSPMYSISTTNSNGNVVNVTIKVKGYPAKYTNFRQMTDNDAKLVSISSMIDSEMDTQFIKSKSVSNTEKIVKQ